MAQPSVAPDAYPYQPPSYEECMGNQPPRYAPGAGAPGMHPPPPPPPHAYAIDTSLSEYERAKRERKKRILTVGLVMTLCVVFLFIILYIKLNLFHEAQRRHMENHFRFVDKENSYWSQVPDRTYQDYTSRVDSPRLTEQHLEDLQVQLKNFWNSVTPLGFKSEDKSTKSNLEIATESYELNNETAGLVDGANSDK